MKTRIQRYIRIAAIRKALTKRAPNRIPIGGSDLSHRDYFTTRLELDDDHSFLVERIDSNGLRGHVLDRIVRQSRVALVPYQLVWTKELVQTHYYKEIQIKYTNPLEFLVAQVFRFPWFQLRVARLRQWLFARRKIIRAERTHVLRLFVDRAVEDRDFRVDSVSFVNEMHRNAWAHPEAPRLHRYYLHILESLVHSGDLVKTNDAYQINAKAFATIANFEQENRRHRDMVRHQIILAVLTAALVGVGLLQAGVAFFATQGK